MSGVCSLAIQQYLLPEDIIRMDEKVIYPLHLVYKIWDDTI